MGDSRSFFAGSNTCVGFYSFYDNIIDSDATRIFIIKGGPGVGKSTFMQKVGAKMKELGYDLELFYCSSDNTSLDGMVIPKLKIALLDGTCPHVVEPKNPGVVEEILNLAQFWDEENIIKNKDSILKVNSDIKRMFKTAYFSLKEAKVAYDELENYIIGNVKNNENRKILNQIISEIFSSHEPQYEKAPKERHLFATAITPNGKINQFKSILKDCSKIYLLEGRLGTGTSEIIENVYNVAKRYGLDLELFHCGFNPDKLNGIYLPLPQVAVINVAEKIDFKTVDKNITITTFNLNENIDLESLEKYDSEIKNTEVRYKNNFERAIHYLKKAKQLHDVLENYYIPTMNFDKLNSYRKEIIEKIMYIS